MAPLIVIPALLIPLAVLALLVWALVSVIGANFENDLEKLIWVLVIVFFPLVGSLIWLAWGNSARRLSAPPAPAAGVHATEAAAPGI